MRQSDPTKVGGKTPNEIAESLVAAADRDGFADTEETELARAFLAAAGAWRAFDQQRLDEILLSGERPE